MGAGNCPKKSSKIQSVEEMLEVNIKKFRKSMKTS